jgi:hypothetical protein
MRPWPWIVSGLFGVWSLAWPALDGHGTSIG